jgi:Uma2 family endonuclease
MSAAPKIPEFMTLAEFLGWSAPGQELWQLVEGAPVAMAPASRTHGAIQSELGALIRNHLLEKGSPCSVVTTPGVVPRVRANVNCRIPDLAVVCSRYQIEESALTDPVLVIEILSPSNHAETWSNVWTYTTIPSVKEIVIVRTSEIGVEFLRRGADGSWPEQPTLIAEGAARFESIGLALPVEAIYRTTRFQASS